MYYGGKPAYKKGDESNSDIEGRFVSWGEINQDE
ncbi:MAG: hypothetical protein CM15mP87_09830 [Candidatus Neomarinimicrobiota bacterium]|nr:MAG: hypothetical protein CM15mP87_09830 [Candidatus Neomarinimicrobiota bacterium]